MNIYKVRKFTRKFLRNFIKPFLKGLLVVALILFLGWFINNAIYGNLIWNNAYRFQLSGEYHAAVNLYNYTVKYLSKTDFIPSNRQKYIEVQYRKAICYLKLNQINLADEAIKEGMYLMMESFGLNSKEYAEYVRMYVVEYYIQKKDFKLASDYLKLAEYLYLKLKTNGNELASINRLYGDLYYALGNEKLAAKYYQNAYRLTNKYKELDIDSVIVISQRIANWYIRHDMPDQAVFVYSKLLDLLQTRNCKDKTKYAYVKWLLASAYAANGRNETAIGYFNDAYAVIKKLPEHYYLKKNIDNLREDMVKCYSALGRHGMAEKIQKQIKINKGS